MDSANSLMYLLDHVTSLLDKQSDQVLQEQFGIGMAQFKILRTLLAKPRLTQRQLARELGQTEASISRQVSLMLGQGLLQSVRKSEDRRRHLTTITHKGERLADAATLALERYHRPTLAALSEKQRGQLTSVLEAVHAQICPEQHARPSADQTMLTLTK